jgi:hypothetical protein
VGTYLPLRACAAPAETPDAILPPTVAAAPAPAPAEPNGRDARTSTDAPALQCQAFSAQDFPAVTPLLAAPPGEAITLTSPKAMPVCVRSADGVVWAETLQPGVPRRFDGAAPWRLQSDGLRQIQVQLQGRPLRWPAYVKDRAELQERRDVR